MQGNIDIKTSWSPSFGNENYFIIAFKNPTSATIPNGQIELSYNHSEVQPNMPDILLYGRAYNTTPGASSNGLFTNGIQWDFDDLKPQETRYIYVPANVSLSPGSLLRMSATLKTSITDPESADPIFFVRRYPHDPNFKIVDKECPDAWKITEPDIKAFSERI